MFETIIAAMKSKLGELPDLRKPSNGTKYDVLDAILSAYSVFFMQSPSFLAHEQDRKREQGKNNLENLFGVHKTPTTNQIKNILDLIPPEAVGAVFWEVWEQLDKANYLEEFRGINGTFLCGMDGTEYHSSYTVCCENCNRKQKGEQTLCSHNVIAPVLVAPGWSEVVSLEPEFIWPQDGSEKEDCEQNAIKRWVERNHQRFAPYSLTILADDLHSRQPTCELLLAKKINFILVCKESSHPALYEELDLLSRLDGAVSTSQERVWNGRFHEVRHYRYASALPLRAGDDALRVNWCEVTVLNQQTGAILYKSAFITNFAIADENVAKLIRSGRARWKNENESHNTLKNHGYNLEHNFGHGDHHLSMILLCLNLLAFLTHTFMEISDTIYRTIRRELGSRKTFWDDVRALTRYHIFDSWSQLLSFMFTQLKLEHPPPAS
jgi:hypothetical protein